MSEEKEYHQRERDFLQDMVLRPRIRYADTIGPPS